MRANKYFILRMIALAAILFSGCKQTATTLASFKVESSAFTDGGMLPVKYTCDGAGI